VSALGHSGMNLTLDLAGVTGVIVSVGITVDSYIVYFERLKDEVRTGRSVRTSVDRSFKGAFRTVLAADLVSLAAAVVLWLLAVGTVRGFAFFLGLSTLLDVFTTFFFTRPLVILLGRNARITSARGFGLARGLALETEPA
jgi:preprotein translocase subunit SecD